LVLAVLAKDPSENDVAAVNPKEWKFGNGWHKDMPFEKETK